MTDVKSSNVASVSHDPQTSELTVEFKNGGRYVYHGISADQHDALLNAKSIGSHLHKTIKPAAKSVRNITSGEGK